MSNPWPALERIPNLAAVPRVWRQHLGDDFDSFSSAFLQRSAHAVRFYPCPRGCGCAHEIIRFSDTDVLAVCRCESWSCDDLKLSADDIMPLELSWARFCRALAQVFQLEPKIAALNFANMRQIGSWSAAAVSVMFDVPETKAAFRRGILELATRLRQPFILLAPTATQCDAAAQELLAQTGAGFFPLAAHVAFEPHGNLRLARAPGELFARFTPQPRQPLDDDVARRAFALVQQLDSDELGKPPSVLTVFRLYCMEELTAAQAARKLHCSKPTVLRRLELLRRKTGLEPAVLRRMSAHLSKVEDGLTDSRARHIHRRAAIDAAEEDERED
jgi:hypothetical protein